MNARHPAVKVNIRNIAVGGDGVGEVTSQGALGADLLGITAFVPFTIPGEEVSAQVIEEKKNYVKAKVVEIERPADVRIEPLCKHFTVCGGCELQHMSYESQCDAKTLMIEGALRAARVSFDVLNCLKPMIEGRPFSYRRRVTFHVDTSGRVGFYRANSRSVVQIDKCPVAVPEINALLEKIREFGFAVLGQISSLILDADEQGAIAVLASPEKLSAQEVTQLVETAKSFFSDFKIIAAGKEVARSGRQLLELPLADKARTTLKIPAGGFSQVNWEINQELIAAVLSATEPHRDKVVHDLFAGAGNFALPLARAGARVTAVECEQELAKLGRKNAERYSQHMRLNFVESSVEKFLRDNKQTNKADCIVADPPRSGLGPLTSKLGYANQLLLISCHLPSFVRDLKNLIAEGWKVQDIQPFDMFAQTSYVEILCRLER